MVLSSTHSTFFQQLSRRHDVIPSGQMGLDLVLCQQHKVSAFSCDALECPWTEMKSEKKPECMRFLWQMR